MKSQVMIDQSELKVTDGKSENTALRAQVAQLGDACQGLYEQIQELQGETVKAPGEDRIPYPKFVK